MPYKSSHVLRKADRLGSLFLSEKNRSSRSDPSRHAANGVVRGVSARSVEACLYRRPAGAVGRSRKGLHRSPNDRVSVQPETSNLFVRAAPCSRDPAQREYTSPGSETGRSHRSPVRLDGGRRDPRQPPELRSTRPFDHPPGLVEPPRQTALPSTRPSPYVARSRARRCWPRRKRMAHTRSCLSALSTW